MRIPFLSTVALCLIPLACSAGGTPRPSVVATIGMLGDVAENVAGDCVDVDTLMGPGVDPHLYEARSSDVRELREAEAILYAGYSLEGQLGSVLERLSRDRLTVAVSPASVEPAELIAVEDLYGIDPHLWMDVSLWARTVPTIRDALGEVAPGCAEAMAERADAYRDQLAALHDWIDASIASIPAEQRVLVTAHDAFAYYGRAYDIEVEAVQGISTDSEAGIRDIRRMVDIIVERGVPAVFVESTINPRTVEAVVEGVEARDHTVRIGGELYSDAMGNADTPAGTYIGMQRSNTRTIVGALGGEPAPWPDALAGWAQRWLGEEDD